MRRTDLQPNGLHPKQIEELLAATLLIHEVEDREVHGSAPREESSTTGIPRRAEPHMAEKGQPPNRLHEPRCFLSVCYGKAKLLFGLRQGGSCRLALGLDARYTL